MSPTLFSVAGVVMGAESVMVGSVTGSVVSWVVRLDCSPYISSSSIGVMHRYFGVLTGPPPTRDVNPGEKNGKVDCQLDQFRVLNRRKRIVPYVETPTRTRRSCF